MLVQFKLWLLIILEKLLLKKISSFTLRVKYHKADMGLNIFKHLPEDEEDDVSVEGSEEDEEEDVESEEEEDLESDEEEEEEEESELDSEEAESEEDEAEDDPSYDDEADLEVEVEELRHELSAQKALYKSSIKENARLRDMLEKRESLYAALEKKYKAAVSK